ncbi:MAG TPA: SH3 domain-containing protein [Stellaceae bacterium]|nr:SH3 domain-containing protein [Stellaceae bacterium]
MRFIVALPVALLLAAGAARAADEKLPHFAALRVDEVNLRAGPGDRYPIEWVYHRKGLPVEVTATFDVWRKVHDSDGTEGWVHERMLSATRSIVVAGGERTLRADPAPGAAPVARAEAGVVARLLECRSSWCRVETQGIKGWLPENDVWGVAPGETVQ